MATILESCDVTSGCHIGRGVYRSVVLIGFEQLRSLIAREQSAAAATDGRTARGGVRTLREDREESAIFIRVD